MRHATSAALGPRPSLSTDVFEPRCGAGSSADGDHAACALWINEAAIDLFNLRWSTRPDEDHIVINSEVVIAVIVER